MSTLCAGENEAFWDGETVNRCFRGVLCLGPSYVLGFVGFLFARAQLKDKRLRMAMCQVWQFVEAIDYVRLVLFVLCGLAAPVMMLLAHDKYGAEFGLVEVVDAALDVVFWTGICFISVLKETRAGSAEFFWMRMFTLVQLIGEGGRLWSNMIGAEDDWPEKDARHFMVGAEAVRIGLKCIASFTLVCFNRDWRRLRKALRKNLVADDLHTTLIEVEDESFASSESECEENSDLLAQMEAAKPGDESFLRLKRTGEQYAGLFSRILFLWVSPLMQTGYERTLEKTDFCRILREDESDQLHASFSKAFEEERALKQKKLEEKGIVLQPDESAPLASEATDNAGSGSYIRLPDSADVEQQETEAGAGEEGEKDGKKSEPKKDEVDEGDTGDLWLILRAMHKSGVLVPFYQAGLLKVVSDSLGFVSPQILKRLIQFLQAEDAAISEGYFYVGLMFFSAVVQTLVLHAYFQLVTRTGLRVRSALVTTIYRKSLRLTPSARQKRTNGQVVNLMSTDVERLNNLFTYLHILWSSPFQIVVALFFLWQELKYSVLVAIAIIMIILTPLTVFVAKALDRIQGELMKMRDNRVRITNESLSSIKVLKMYGWVRSFMERVIGEREKELSTLRKFAYFIAGAYMCWGATPVLLTLCSFGTFSLIGGTLDPPTALTSLSLLKLLEFPLSVLPHVFSSLVEAAVSFRRISSFLESEELDLEVLDKIRKETPTPRGVSIVVSDGSFFWDDKRSKQALRDVNFEVKEGSLCVITGEVGSGKSALMAMLIGELQPAENPLPKVGVVGSVAYAAQVPWIQNATVKENILFGCPLEPEWYQKVVRACCLLPDFEQLPNGDACSIGERGINLSGGQKARIALARAVYSRADILLLETCFEAVDEHVGAFLWKNCFRGILQERNPTTGRRRTVLVITHALKYAHDADQILIMKGGTVVEQGKFDDIMKNSDSELARLSLRVDHSSREKSKSVDAEDQAHEKEEVSAGGESESTSKPPAEEKPTEEEEEIAVGHVSWSVYWKYIESIGGLGVIAVVISIVILQTALESGTTAWLAYWSSQGKSGHSADTGFYLGIYATLSIGSLAFTSVLVMVLFLAALHASRRVHNLMLDSIFRAPMAFFDTTPLGRILNRFSKDIYTIDENLPSEILDMFQSGFAVLGAVATIAIVTPQILVVVPVLCIAYWWIQRYYVATSRQLKRWDSVLRSPIYSHFTESLDGLTTIRAFSATLRFSDHNQSQLDRQVSASYLSVSSNRWLAVRLEFLGTAFVGSSAFFVVLLRDTIDPAFGGMAVTYSLSITWALAWTVRMIAQIETDAVSVERVNEYINVPTEAPEDDPEPTKVPEPQQWPLNGEIVLDNVWARYRPGLDYVLRGVNMKIVAGEKIGVVGRTGSGKSTTFGLLLRLIEPEKGRVLIDGYDLQLFGLERLRQSCAIIPQDPVMFNTTLRENLDPLKIYSDEEIWVALEHTQLKEHVEKLDDKLETAISEGGTNFSFGQRQLICIARVILRRCKIILCDEATSGIDNYTDEMIHSTIRREFKESTVLTIAHRLTTIMDAGRIVVMDKGVVKEFAPPSELLENPDSLFSSLVKQMKNSKVN